MKKRLINILFKTLKIPCVHEHWALSFSHKNRKANSWRHFDSYYRFYMYTLDNIIGIKGIGKMFKSKRKGIKNNK